MAAKKQIGCAFQEYSCEICGKSGLTDDEMRHHTKEHVEVNPQCPFCGLTGIPAAELLLHVNSAHLDYLTPENELMSFIDDQSPSSYFSADGDSDSMSDYNHSTPDKLNGTSTSKNFFQTGQQSSINHNSNSKSKLTKIEVTQHLESTSSTNGIICDMNGTSSKDHHVNGFDKNPKGGQGSPLRSQLGLKLKSHTSAVSVKQSPLQCPLCPYTSESPTVMEEHINIKHFDPLSPSVNNGTASSNHVDTLSVLACPICVRIFESGPDLELHVNIEHRDILSPGKTDHQGGASASNNSLDGSLCPVCGISLEKMKTQEMELHIEAHFAKTPQSVKSIEPNLEKEAQKLREQREFEMLRAQYGMDDQGNFREQSSANMQRAVYAGEMSVADYYERQVGLRAAESHGIDDGTSSTKSIAARVLALSSSSPGVIRSFVSSAVDHYASSYGDKGWGCGYRNLQMLLSSLLQNTTYNEAIYSAWGTHGPSRTAMPSISRLQKMAEAAWAQGFDVQGSEQLGCKLYNTRKWIGATEIVTVLSWLRINCQLIDFHRATSSDGRHPELFNWVLKYFEEGRDHISPLYLQHQGHSRTIIGIEQRSSGYTLLVLDPSHGPRQVAALGSSQDSLRLVRRGPGAMKAPQYQIVAVKGLIETEEQFQASKVLRSLRIPPDR